MLLDCTLRDGGYTNDWKFSDEFVKDLYETCNTSNIDYIEIGFRRSHGHNWFNATDDMIHRVITKKGVCKIAIMAQVGTFTIDDFVPRDKSYIDMVRVLVAYHEDDGIFEKALENVKQLRDFGYEVSLNIGRADKLDEITKQRIRNMFKDKIDYLWFADTYGNFTQTSTIQLVNEFKNDFKVGFHAHDNLRNATDKSFYSGAYIIDSTMNGIGRGVGNARTELLVQYKIPCCEFIHKHMNGSKLELLSIITAEKSIHINYAIELAKTNLSIVECCDYINNLPEPNRYEPDIVRKCFCGSDDNTLIYSESIPNFEDSPLGTEIRVKKCNTCGFIFSDNFRTQKHYDTYYTQNVAYMKGKISGEKRYHETAEIVKKYTTPDSKIADVGCGPGTILHILNQNGYTNLIGVDPSSESLNITGVNSVQSTLFDYNDSCDFMILSHILEHVYDLEKAMKSINSHRIYVEVPNVEKYATRLPFQDFNIEHINHFSHKSLTNLFDKYGYSCIEFSEKIIEGWYSSFYAVFEKRAPWTYIEESKSKIEQMKTIVGNTPINILGAGLLCRRFLNMFNIHRVFDDAEWMHGKKIGKNTIEPFDENDDTPLITSNFYIPTKGKNNIDIWKI
jgi:ubiquinone/menaquinone biosynthesis C-methylase UbiE